MFARALKNVSRVIACRAVGVMPRAKHAVVVRHFTDEAAATHGNNAQHAQHMSGTREQGTVKWFDPSKGFGFIVRDDGQDLFVHFSGVRGTGYRTLEEGQKVEFVVGTGQKGPMAQDVTLVGAQ